MSMNKKARFHYGRADACVCVCARRVFFFTPIPITGKQTNIYLSPSERDILPLAVIVKLFDFTNICFPKSSFILFGFVNDTSNE